MRLGAILLSVPLTLGAQEQVEPAWRAESPSAEAPAPPVGVPGGGRTVRLTGDGVLHVYDAKGIRRLRLGLPGRPAGVWRDGGVPVVDPLTPMTFPAETPLSRGLGALPLGAKDFRPALQGLLWVLDDGDRALTLVHPATSQAIRLRLPRATGFELRFHPDRLELVASDEGANRRAWSLPWLALLPQYLQLGRPLPGPPPGTALNPFPN